MVPYSEQPTHYDLPTEQVTPPQMPFPSYSPLEPPLPPHKPSRKRRWVLLVLAVILLILAGVAIYSLGLSAGKSGDVSRNTASSPTPAQQVTATQPPTETATPAQITPPIDKSAYLNSTVGNLDKLGTEGKGNFYHFTATILRLVKDEQGNTGGANVSGTGSDSGVIQVIFPSATDLTRLNTGDTIEVWGYDGGVFSGANAFGATVQEVGVLAVYLTDTTTGYSE